MQDESQYKCTTHTAGGQRYTFCNCHGTGCNYDWKTAGQESALECYACSSLDENSSCDEADSGELTRCQPGDKGCFISQVTSGGFTAFERGCTEVTDESKYTCQQVVEGGHQLHYCNCHGSRCNEDWTSAGEVPPGPSDSIKCYQCSSLEGGQCDGHYPGEQVDCPANDGCLISYETTADGNLFVRDCADAHDGGQAEARCDREDYGGIEGSNLRYCVCLTSLCNEGWEEAGSTSSPQTTEGPTESPSEGLQCYKCDSAVDGLDACNDSPSNMGELVTCPPQEAKGCFIGEVLMGDDKTVVTRGCTALENEDLYKCDMHTAGNQVFTFCNCHGNGCNKDWDTAGEKSSLECYQCNSVEDEAGCSDTVTGELERCGPGDKGCFISRATYGSDVAFERGCTEVSDENLYKCQTVEDSHGGNALHFCNCHGSACNKDWTSAGGEDQPTQSPPDNTIKCYSCDSKENKCSEFEFGSKIDCPASTGCRIAKKNDLEDPMYVRDCAIEEDFFCDTFDNPDGEDGTSSVCTCGTELCNQGWVSAGSSTTNAGQWTDPTTPASSSSGRFDGSLNPSLFISTIVLLQICWSPVTQ